MSKIFKVSSIPNSFLKKINLKPKKITGCKTSKGKPEKQIEEEICNWLSFNKISYWKIKIKGDPFLSKDGLSLKKNGNKGFSDILICFKGRMICLEVKKNGGLCSSSQLETQMKVRNSLGIYEFVTSLQEVHEIFDRINQVSTKV